MAILAPPVRVVGGRFLNTSNSGSHSFTRRLLAPPTGTITTVTEEDYLHFAANNPKGPLTQVATVATGFFPFNGVLKEVQLHAHASNVTPPEAIFDVNIGTAGAMATIFQNPADRPRIAVGATYGERTGLNASFQKGWRYSIDLDQMPPGGVPTPVWVVFVLERVP